VHLGYLGYLRPLVLLFECPRTAPVDREFEKENELSEWSVSDA